MIQHTPETLGFHGDKHLRKIVDILVKEGQIDYFIETGTNRGMTLAYFAKCYKNVQCISCEPVIGYYNTACDTCKKFSNVIIKNESSQNYISWLKQHPNKLFNCKVLFWLDAHGAGFDWPLLDEIKFITENFTSCYILIDDFKVPSNPMFGFDSYNNQKCEHDYIKDVIFWTKNEYKLFYPSYTDRTGEIHPLRGWGLYTHNMPVAFLNDHKKIIKNV